MKQLEKYIEGRAEEYKRNTSNSRQYYPESEQDYTNNDIKYGYLAGFNDSKVLEFAEFCSNYIKSDKGWISMKSEQYYTTEELYLLFLEQNK